MRKLAIFVRPLAFPEIDEPIASQLNKKVSADSFLGYFCTPGLPSDVESLVARYREIAQNELPFFSAPNEQRILDKLVWPLRQAKGSFVCGNYIGTISLCGMVAEMVAILLFELQQPQINNQPLDDPAQVRLFGSTFERLSQERRVNVLQAYQLIAPSQAEAFGQIRRIRRQYLHLWSQDHDQLPTDASSAYHAALSLVTSVIVNDVKEGVMYLPVPLASYLDRKGVYMPEGEES